LTDISSCHTNAKEGQMWRFLLPAFFAMIGAWFLLFTGGRGDAQSTPGVAGRVNDIVGDTPPSHAAPPLPTPPAQGSSVSDDRATDLRHQVSDLQDLVAQVSQQLAQRKAQSPATGDDGQRGAPDASQSDDLQRQDSELHNELQGLITQLQQELQLEEQSPPVTDVAEQQERQAARDALKREIADLQREDNELQGLMAHRGAAVAQREPERQPAPDAGQQTTAGDALEYQAADLRSEIADLQRQDDALQRQLAAHRQELAERTRELDAARAEADNLRQSLDTLRRQRQAEEASLALDRLRQGIDTYRQQRQADDASGGRQKPQEQPQATTAAPARLATSKPSTQPTPPVSARPPGQPTPPAQPAQPMPAASAWQQLQAAQQWLSAGRPDEARRVLAMVQTQVVFQPGTPDQPDSQVSNPTMTDVGDAIRWLDMGAGGQAMEAITRAIGDANPGGGAAAKKR
jgi:hypothetical protein